MRAGPYLQLYLCLYLCLCLCLCLCLYLSAGIQGYMDQGEGRLLSQSRAARSAAATAAGGGIGSCSSRDHRPCACVWVHVHACMYVCMYETTDPVHVQVKAQDK